MWCHASGMPVCDVMVAVKAKVAWRGGGFCSHTVSSTSRYPASPLLTPANFHLHHSLLLPLWHCSHGRAVTRCPPHHLAGRHFCHHTGCHAGAQLFAHAMGQTDTHAH